MQSSFKIAIDKQKITTTVSIENYYYFDGTWDDLIPKESMYKINKPKSTTTHCKTTCVGEGILNNNLALLKCKCNINYEDLNIRFEESFHDAQLEFNNGYLTLKNFNYQIIAAGKVNSSPGYAICRLKKIN